MGAYFSCPDASYDERHVEHGLASEAFDVLTPCADEALASACLSLRFAQECLRQALVELRSIPDGDGAVHRVDRARRAIDDVLYALE